MAHYRLALKLKQDNRYGLCHASRLFEIFDGQFASRLISILYVRDKS